MSRRKEGRKRKQKKKKKVGGPEKCRKLLLPQKKTSHLERQLGSKEMQHGVRYLSNKCTDQVPTM